MNQATVSQGNTQQDDSMDSNSAVRSTRTKAEMYQYLGKNLFFAALTYASMVLYYFELIPLWGMIVVNVLFYIRAYLRMHDLCHGFSTKGWMVRFLPTSLYGNPVWGGVTAFMTTHLEHHRYLGTDRDPWLYYYEGHPLKAFFFNMIEPEVNLYNYLKWHGINRKLMENLVFDVAKIIVHLMIFQMAYLTYMIVQRTCHGVGVFLFNFFQHRENFKADSAIGSFNREAALKPYAPFVRMFWGKALIEAAFYHNRHHVLKQMQEPSHRYVLLSDDGPQTLYTKKWPLHGVQHLDLSAVSLKESVS